MSDSWAELGGRRARPTVLRTADRSRRQASRSAIGRRTESAGGRLAAEEFLVRTPELPARVMKIILRHLESLDRRGCGNPTASDRLDHRQRFKSV
jgi:hypothetical protein